MKHQQKPQNWSSVRLHIQNSKEFLLKTVCKVQDKLQSRKNNFNSQANSAKNKRIEIDKVNNNKGKLSKINIGTP